MNFLSLYFLMWFSPRFLYSRSRFFLFSFCSSFNQCWIILSCSRSHATKDMVLYYVKATGLTGFSQLDIAIYEYSTLLISNFTSLRIKARPTLRLFVRPKNLCARNMQWIYLYILTFEFVTATNKALYSGFVYVVCIKAITSRTLLKHSIIQNLKFSIQINNILVIHRIISCRFM